MELVAELLRAAQRPPRVRQCLHPSQFTLPEVRIMRTHITLSARSTVGVLFGRGGRKEEGGRQRGVSPTTHML